jgi:hypothetical protein
MTALHDIILLKRDPSDTALVRELDQKEGLDYLIARDFCNPHQLVRDARKAEIRAKFFSKFLEGANVHLVNTIAPPERTQAEIRRLVDHT